MAKTRLGGKAAEHLERLGEARLCDLLVEELGVGRLVPHRGGKGGKSLVEERKDSSPICSSPGGWRWNCKASFHSDQDGHQIDKTSHSAEHCATPGHRRGFQFL